jgi:hypothetical protein
MSMLVHCPILEAPMVTSRYARPLPLPPKGIHILTRSFQRIDHAGFSRYILKRNPPRYTPWGDELEDSESDPEADADFHETDAYADVHINGRIALAIFHSSLHQLTRTAETLAPLKHPSELASHPSLSQTFLDSALPDMVQSTETTLRQEKAALYRAKRLHAQLIGDEAWVPLGSVETPEDWDLFEPKSKQTEQRSKKRKRDEPEAIGVSVPEMTGTSTGRASPDGVPEFPDIPDSPPEQNPAPETTMQDQHPVQASEEGQEQQPEPVPTTNGIQHHSNDNPSQPNSTSSTPPPPRRITRALAAENNPSPRSPTLSTISSDLLEPDSLFLATHTPTTSLPNLTSLLPHPERTETRRLLTMYIQKQEETIRCTEAVLGKLIKALRMRDQLLEWSKAEGHVGEWSDGEDWIDAEAWGEREVDLRKGRDEDDPNAGNGDDEAGGASIVGIGGKKKKRKPRGEANVRGGD